MLHPGDRIGDWEIVLPLGQGGMGSVYRCRHALSERIEAAVKVLEPTDRPGARERFIREAEALHALRHPAIVRTAGFGQDAATGLMWLAMELVHGENFERLLHRGRFPRDRIAETFGPVAAGLAYAHSRGIVHRDIKPGNLMLQQDGSSVLLDFGIAVQEGQDRLTREGVVPGTVAYAAPELVTAGATPDPALVDVYALGQVLCECLTGSFTYPRRAGMDPHRRAVRILREKLRAVPLDPGEGVAPRIRELVRSATEPDPARRGPPLAEWAAILEEGPIIDDEATASLTADDVGGLASMTSDAEVILSTADQVVPERSPPASAETAPEEARAAPVSPALPRRAGRAALWLGLGAAALVVLLGVLLLVLTAAGGAAAWWSLSSAPVTTVTPDMPLGDVLVVEDPPAPVAAVADEVELADPALAPTVAEGGRPVRKARSAEPGRLVLASDPAADVYLDGTLLRRTPLSREVPAGRHGVELVASDGRRKRFTVVVDPAESVRRMWAFDDGEWRSFDGGVDEAGLPARPANVGDAARLLRALPDTAACLDEAGVAGPITVAFTVAPDGSVVAEGVRQAEHRDTELDVCLRRAARQLAFGPSVAGAAVSVDIGG